MDASMLESFVWVAVPALLLGVITIACRYKYTSIPRDFYVVAALSSVAGGLLAPTCPCTELTQKLQGALLASIPVNIVVFGCAAAWIRYKRRLAQQAAQERRA